MSLVSPCFQSVSTYNTPIKPIMLCRCRRFTRELTILKAQYVKNAFDQGFMKESAALMISLTFPGAFKDSSWANQIRVLSLSLRLGSMYAASLLAVWFFMVRR